MQWEAGKSRYQALANETIADLNNDITLGPDTMKTIKRLPEKVRDSFRTSDAAREYVESSVIPDLEASGVPAGEIKKVREYLYEIADHKPYQTQADFDAGTKVNPRGRARKPQN